MNNEYIPRDIETLIMEAYRYFPVITLTGPRQTGKTTTIRHQFPNLRYYSLENPDIRVLAHDDPKGFLSLHDEGMIIDEVQRETDLLSYIQGIVDETPSKRFVLSGSSNFALLRNVSQSLAGRSGVYEMLPLSLSEIGEDRLSKNLNELLYNGMFPAVVSGNNIARLTYPAYIRTYLERDVRDLLNVKDMRLFNVFLRLCAGRIGSIYNASQLADEVGVSIKTIQAWISVLEASYVLFLLPPYYENNRKRLTKSPKMYFCDTGLACSLLGIDSADKLSFHNMRGHLFENLVVMEMLKRRFNKGKESNLYFYRDSNQNEIDLVADNTHSVELMEIKSAMTYDPAFGNTLRKADTWFTKPVSKKTIVYAGDMEMPQADIRIVNYRHL